MKPRDLFSMPFMVERYLRKTKCLTLEEHGAYLLLLCEMWMNKGALKADDDDLARLLRVSPEVWQRLKPRLWPLLRTYGEGDGSLVTQETLQEQWNYAVANSERQKIKGALGGKRKAEKERILKSLSSPGYSAGCSPGNGHGDSPRDGREVSPALAILDKNITTTSQKNTDGLPSRFETPLMQKKAPNAR